MEVKLEEKKEESCSDWYYCRCFVIIVVALAAGVGYFNYINLLFENDRNFSHLSNLEREMSLRTEMGFYYSYYKTLLLEGPFVSGLNRILSDYLVEYPYEVNAFNRFNIHPEILFGALYRYLEPRINHTRECHIVNRGSGLSSVESCIGLGEPIMFYMNSVFALAAATLPVLFLYATTLSDSVTGGVFALTSYLASHGHCTRVMWAPNERENLARPLLLMQMWLVTRQLRYDATTRATLRMQVGTFMLTSLCLLFWQFSQFIFLTQLAIFFVMEQLKIIDSKSFCMVLHAHFCGLHISVLLLQGNDMLKSSLYSSFFIVVSCYAVFFSTLRINVKTRFDLFVESWLVLLRIAIVGCTSFWLKKTLSDFLLVEEDSHIWDILYSKFTDFKSFHTSLYTCSEVFDFLPTDTWLDLFTCMLIPSTLLAITLCVRSWLVCSKKDLDLKTVDASKKRKKRRSFRADYSIYKDYPDSEEDSGIENTSDAKIIKEYPKPLFNMAAPIENDKLIKFLKNLEVDAAAFYNISQMVVFGMMATLVMRLKLLFVPHMCLISSIVMNLKLYPTHRYLRFNMKAILLPVIFAYTAFCVYATVMEETSNVGEFSDLPQEELLTWISQNCSERAVFAGPMPLMATVMLSTRRAIVNHPHYEHKEARDRNYAVYKTYGRFSPLELYHELSKLRVTHLIIDKRYCYGKSSKGCTFENIWDAEAPSLLNEPRLCHRLLESDTEHYYPLLDNRNYRVLRLHDLSVRYMPRSFNT